MGSSSTNKEFVPRRAEIRSQDFAYSWVGIGWIWPPPCMLVESEGLGWDSLLKIE